MKQSHAVEMSISYGLETPSNQASYDPMIYFGGSAVHHDTGSSNVQAEPRVAEAELGLWGLKLVALNY